MTPPRALILDFGGVLTTDLWESVRNCARREGLPADRLAHLLMHDPDIHPLFAALERGDITQEAFEERLGAAAGIPPHRLLARMCADLRPDEAMLAAVAALRARGVLIGVLSNSWGSGYFNPYDGYDLNHLADAVLISGGVQLRKPDPAIFELILNKLGTQPRDAVFVDDVAVNLPPAAALGMTTIHHTHTPATRSVAICGLAAGGRQVRCVEALVPPVSTGGGTDLRKIPARAAEGVGRWMTSSGGATPTTCGGPRRPRVARRRLTTPSTKCSTRPGGGGWPSFGSTATAGDR